MIIDDYTCSSRLVKGKPCNELQCFNSKFTILYHICYSDFTITLAFGPYFSDQTLKATLEGRSDKPARAMGKAKLEGIHRQNLL